MMMPALCSAAPLLQRGDGHSARTSLSDQVAASCGIGNSSLLVRSSEVKKNHMIFTANDLSLNSSGMPWWHSVAATSASFKELHSGFFGR